MEIGTCFLLFCSRESSAWCSVSSGYRNEWTERGKVVSAALVTLPSLILDTTMQLSVEVRAQPGSELEGATGSHGHAVVIKTTGGWGQPRDSVGKQRWEWRAWNSSVQGGNGGWGSHQGNWKVTKEVGRESGGNCVREAVVSGKLKGHHFNNSYSHSKHFYSTCCASGTGHLNYTH